MQFVMSSSSKVASFYLNFAAEQQLETTCEQWQSPSRDTTMFTPSPSNSFASDAMSPDPDDPDYMQVGPPMLQIIEQPVSSFRFRYRSEMQGAHGSLLGRGRENSRKRCYPTVRLLNYDGDAIIRCSLYTDTKPPKPHMHQLIAKLNNEDVFDHEQLVSERNGYKAEFKGLGIVHMSKKHLNDELIRKKKLVIMEKLRQDEKYSQCSDEDFQEAIVRFKNKIAEEAEKETKTMDPNKVKLCFEAFARDDRGCLKPICGKVLSDTIQNMKSAETGELKICRIDRYMGSCRGGDEVFILVEKVCKKNIQVRFYEEENGKVIWSENATFNEYDVHHQYAIVFRTPAYKDLDIEENKNVKIQLYRPKNHQFSEPLHFVYKPARKYRKRIHEMLNSESLSSADSASLREKLNAPSGKRQMLQSDLDPLLSGGSNSFESVNSEVIRHALEELAPDISQGLDVDSIDFLNSPEGIYEYAKHSNISEEALQSLGVSGDKVALSADFMDQFTFYQGDDNPLCGDLDVRRDLKPDGGNERKGTKKKAPGTSKQSHSNALEHEMLVTSRLNTSNQGFNANFEVPERLVPKIRDMHKSMRIFAKKRGYSSFEGIEQHCAPDHSETEELGEFVQHMASPKHPSIVEEIDARRETSLTDTQRAPWLQAKQVYPILRKLINSKDPDLKPEIKKLMKCGEAEDGPLHTAAYHGQVKELGNLLSLLIRQNLLSLINIKNGNKETPLMYAVRAGKLDCVKLLLLAGANISGVDVQENNVLHLAVKYKHHSCLVELLEDKSVNSNEKSLKRFRKEKKDLLDKKNMRGHTALHEAVLMKDIHSVKVLVEAGANPNIKSAKAGMTPLHLSVDVGSLGIAEYLLKMGTVRINEKNLNGKTALELAEESPHKKLVLCLKKYVGDTQMDVAGISKDLHGIMVKEEPMSDNDSDDALHIDEEEKPDEDDEVSSEEYEVAEGDDEDDEDDEGEVKDNDSVGSEEDDDTANEQHFRSPEDHLFDPPTLDAICKILDQKQMWRPLAEHMNINFLSSSIRSFQSPSRCLFGYFECEKSVTAESIRDALQKLDVPDAVKVINTMLKKKS